MRKQGQFKANLPAFGGKPEARIWNTWIPAFAGMTERHMTMRPLRLIRYLKKQSQFAKCYMTVSSFTTTHYGAKVERRDRRNKANLGLRRELMKQF